MILVTLGTQDESFERLLKAIDKKINEGKIKDKVIVQAGYTKYKSDNMEIFDYTSPDKLDELMKEADLLITHGGVGSILGALKYDKPVIAAARLAKYNEHNNNHQLEIISKFSELGYLLPLEDFDKLDEVIKESKNFKPKKFVSNTDNMIKLVEGFINEDNHVSWFNKCKYFILLFIIIIILLIIIL